MLTGRRVFITGASGTVGSAVREAFEEQGASVFGVDSKTGELVTHCDITSESSIRIAFKNAQLGGAVTDVVHAAGVVSCGPVADLSLDEFERIIQVNLIGSFLVAREAIRNIEQPGSITFISSQAGIKSGAYWSAYSASKAGVLRLSEALAQEVGSRLIRVNAVCPGNIQSPMMNQSINSLSAILDKKTSDVLQEYLKGIPVNRFAEPKEIASVCVFLASPLASYVSGSAVVVDGGESS